MKIRNNKNYNCNTQLVFSIPTWPGSCLKLNLLQPVGEVQKCWVSGSILVVSKDQAAIIMHALSHKKLKVTEPWCVYNVNHFDSLILNALIIFATFSRRIAPMSTSMAPWTTHFPSTWLHWRASCMGMSLAEARPLWANPDRQAWWRLSLSRIAPKISIQSAGEDGAVRATFLSIFKL